MAMTNLCLCRSFSFWWKINCKRTYSAHPSDWIEQWTNQSCGAILHTVFSIRACTWADFAVRIWWFLILIVSAIINQLDLIYAARGMQNVGTNVQIYLIRTSDD